MRGAMSAPFFLPIGVPCPHAAGPFASSDFVPSDGKRFVSGHDPSTALRAGFQSCRSGLPSSYPERALAREGRELSPDPGDWKWSTVRHYAFRRMGVVEMSRSEREEIASSK